ncbi:zinc finger MYM-type protein 1 [Caerostris darwini]|uniref:Zinc finger MYM-type protein 1 n=1 Tax=Caerostris darwini TaxID=1538125 RepID=A0AAV4SQK5_9ARAC|nr:zinc finger MYM-type protein 1 [Caerostris darwini]
MHVPNSTTQLKAMQHVVCENTAVALTQSENMELIQEQLTEHEYTNEPQNNTNIENFFQTPNEKHHVQDVANLDRDVKYLEEEIRKEQQYWCRIIERVFAVICTLAERGLPFRGDNEKFGTPSNGNDFGLLELVAKFDPFLRDHIDRYENTGSEKPSYLSKTICEEIIQFMGNKVKDTIMAKVKKTGYLSFSVDSTHTDQLTLIIRYVSPEDGLPTEIY